MKTLIVLLLSGIALVVLWFTTPLGLFLTAIPCGFSPECSTTIKHTEVDETATRAIAAKDVTLCDSLPKEIWFSTAAPRADCYFKYAKGAKDVRACKSFYCYAEVARASEDVSLCDGMDSLPYSAYPHSVTYYKVNCYIEVAATSKNKAICNKIKPDLENELKCLWPFSDRSICSEYPKGARGYGFCLEYFNNKDKYSL